MHRIRLTNMDIRERCQYPNNIEVWYPKYTISIISRKVLGISEKVVSLPLRIRKPNIPTIDEYAFNIDDEDEWYED